MSDYFLSRFISVTVVASYILVDRHCFSQCARLLLRPCRPFPSLPSLPVRNRALSPPLPSPKQPWLCVAVEFTVCSTSQYSMALCSEQTLGQWCIAFEVIRYICVSSFNLPGTSPRPPQPISGKSVTPENFSVYTRDYVGTATTVQILVQIGSVGASPKVGET